MRWNLRELEDHLLVGSTLVEGSTLTENEARKVMSGRTVSGHPIHEIRELHNYRRSVEWLMEKVADSPFLSLDMVRGLHHHLFEGLADQRRMQRES